jgi:RNA polymerase sigma factor (sigma-70 family)
MTTRAMSAAQTTDAELVSASLAGNRDAFGRIVTRYQSLICSLAYSATGCLGQSEDLAQETFITAWKRLRHLREPGKLRAWLCGIARNCINNSLRREGREPLRAAEPLDAVHDAPAIEPLPSDRVISKEEEAVLWRSLERIPETYREPLVLFYREHQSIERVAEELELSQDAVKQRLSRGRKLLHEQVLAFVEGALKRTNPGKAFTLGVLAALPALSLSAKAATLGATAAKGSATAKAAGVLGLMGALLAVPLVLFGNYIGYRMSLDEAQSDREREHIKSFYRKLVGCILGFSVLFGLLMFWARELITSNAMFFTILVVGLALGYGLAILVLTIWEIRTRRKLLAELPTDELAAPSAKPAWEYCSHVSLLGLPLIHIRIGGGIRAQRKPVKAWIAVGDSALGGLFAFGGMAIAPVSIGGCALGLLPFGGCAVGLLALGGFSLGIWSFGGLAFGWQAFGGFAIAWSAAMGGVAVAHDFALGGFAHAAQVNNELAARFIRPLPFFKYGEVALRYLAWLNLIWVVPMIAWWRAVVSKRNQRANSAQ